MRYIQYVVDENLHDTRWRPRLRPHPRSNASRPRRLAAERLLGQRLGPYATRRSRRALGLFSFFDRLRVEAVRTHHIPRRPVAAAQCRTQLWRMTPYERLL